MIFRLTSKNDEFFKLFAQSSLLLRDGAYILKEAMSDHTKIGEKMSIIARIEHEADEINDAIIDKLNQTYITPLDREDIYSLANMLDDGVDFIQGVIERMLLYRTGKPSDGAIELSHLLVECSEDLVSAIGLLKSIKLNQNGILEYARNIVQKESIADSIYRQEVAHLFTSCDEPIEIIKWKEILEYLEKAVDHCELMADLIRGVVLKYA